MYDDSIKRNENISYFEIIISGMLEFIHSYRVSRFDGEVENVFSWLPLEIATLFEFPSFFAACTKAGSQNMSESCIKYEKNGMKYMEGLKINLMYVIHCQ